MSGDWRAAFLNNAVAERLFAIHQVVMERAETFRAQEDNTNKTEVSVRPSDMVVNGESSGAEQLCVCVCVRACACVCDLESTAGG